MSYSFYVTDYFGNRVPVHIRPAREADFDQTESDNWQTSWKTPYIQRGQLEKYAMIVEGSEELIGLCALKLVPEGSCVRMVYMESHPQSNPTLVKTNARKYYGIGKAFLAWAVADAINRRFDGTLCFKAKTTELFYHYRNRYGALPLPYSEYEMVLFVEAGLQLLDDYTNEVN